jgi:Na+-driven multidrug efflux pump
LSILHSIAQIFQQQVQFLLPFFSGIEGVFILYPVSWGLGALLMILYAWKGKWMEYHT